jgi:hypothetical protein
MRTAYLPRARGARERPPPPAQAGAADHAAGDGEPVPQKAGAVN